MFLTLSTLLLDYTVLCTYPSLSPTSEARYKLFVPAGMDATPRTLIRGVQKDLRSPPSSASPKPPPQKAETKNLMRAFIDADTTNSAEHKKILDNPVFGGHYPRIVDKVFTMERFAGDAPNLSNGKSANAKDEPSKRSSKATWPVVDPYENSNPAHFTGFEHFLLCVNVSLFVGIMMTVIVLGLFFLFLNNALYLKEEIS